DRTQLAVRCVDLDGAAIRVLELERCSSGLEHEWTRQCPWLRLAVDSQLERRRQVVVACGDIVEGAGGVPDAEILRRSELQRLQAAGQQDTHARDGCRPERGSGKVVE